MSLGALEQHRVIPVVRSGSQENAARAVDWLREAGFRTFEITLTTPGARELIAVLAREAGLLIGAGTVWTRAEAAAALAAGARYLVSPGLAPDIVAPCREAGAPCLLGALTPTEVRHAVDAGADAVKIFPVGSAGGPGHVRALKAIFPDVALVPTGGIPCDGIAPYLAAGASCVGVGGQLVDEAAIAAGDKDSIVEAGRIALAQIETTV